MDMNKIRRRVLIVSTYYKNYDLYEQNSQRFDVVIEVLRDVGEVVYSRKQVSRIMEKFQQHGTVCDRRKLNPGRPMNQSNYTKTIEAVGDEN